jgi:transcriptional regulator with XRE-family HTH domain
MSFMRLAAPWSQCGLQSEALQGRQTLPQRFGVLLDPLLHDLRPVTDRSDVSQSTISRIEAGETGGISLANLERLADALGINAALLIVHEPKGKRG